MASEESKATSAYMPNGLILVNGTTVVSDLVVNLQREMILLVIGPYEGAYLSLYRNGQELCYWRTTERLSYKQLCAMPHQHRTLAYPEDHQGQCETIRTLVLDTFFAVPAAPEDTQNDLKPPGAVVLTTVREVNRALRAHFARTGGNLAKTCFTYTFPIDWTKKHPNPCQDNRNRVRCS